MPAGDEVTDESANEDADDDVPIVVHGEEHDEVRHSELQHVQQCADELLEDGRCEARCLDGIGRSLARVGGGLLVVIGATVAGGKQIW